MRQRYPSTSPIRQRVQTLTATRSDLSGLIKRDWSVPRVWGGLLTVVLFRTSSVSRNPAGDGGLFLSSVCDFVE